MWVLKHNLHSKRKTYIEDVFELCRWGRGGGVCVSNKEKVAGRRIILRNEELRLFSSGGWIEERNQAGHVSRLVKLIYVQISVEKFSEKGPFGRTRCRWI
jgi:hypothetical protein